MDEKIATLKNLPEFLVNHPQIYSILSKGIHELEEDECLDQFEIILQAAEMIFDQIIEASERQKQEKFLSDRISKLFK